MATLAQRSLQNEGSEDNLGISEEEKQQLLDEINKLNKK